MSSHTIEEINFYRCPVKLRNPFVISLGKLEYADNVIVRVKTKSGITGFGECSPFLTIHGENSRTAMIIGELIAKQLIGCDALDFENTSRIMDASVYANTSVKSAIDIAMYDIAARIDNKPLYEFLGGKNNWEIYTDYTVSIGPVETMVHDAQKIVDDGYTVIKVKLGGTEEEDFLRLSSIRKKVGDDIPIRIDANQGWSVETAISLLQRFESLDIQHCEEPVLRHNFLSLPLIRSKTKIPIMADESCCDDMDAARLVKINGCDLFNVKLGKSSGIFKARKIIGIAEKNKINLQAGGFLESRLGFTAMAHVALSSSRFLFFDFDTPLMFTEDPVSGGIRYGENGEITLPADIGLGATIDESVLDSLESILVK